MAVILTDNDPAFPAITRDELQAARRRIRPHALRSPAVRFDPASSAGPEIYVKLEMLQPVGSFKLRPAANAVEAFEERHPGMLRSRGIVTASSGNWAQGLAWMTALRGIPYTVVVPTSCPAAKIANIRRLNPRSRIAKCDEDEFWRVVTTREFAGADPNAVFLSSVCDRDTIAGGGTIGAELAEDFPWLHERGGDAIDAVLCPTGGGAMAIGIAAALHFYGCPRVRVYAVESEHASPFAAEWGTAPLRAHNRGSFVDCIGNKAIFPGMERFARAALAGSLVVGEAECARAVRLLAERSKVVAEGGSAAALAAALRYGREKGWRRVIALITGGSIDLEKLAVCLKGGVPGRASKL